MPSDPVLDAAVFVPAADPVPGPLAPFEARAPLSSDVTYNKGKYDVFVTNDKGQLYQLTDFVQTITYSTDDQTAYATIDILFDNTPILKSVLQPGVWIFVYGPYFSLNDPIRIGGLSDPIVVAAGGGLYEEVDRGVITIVDDEIGDTKTIAVKAKDPLWYTIKNTLPVRLPQGTLVDRLKVWESLGVFTVDPAIHNTEHIIPPTRGGTQTIWEDILYDLGETNRFEGKHYLIRHRKGKVYLVDGQTQHRRWSFVLGMNIHTMKMQSSIEDYYNRIYVLENSDANLIADVTGSGAGEGTSLKLPYSGLAQNEDEFRTMGVHTLVVPSAISYEFQTAQEQAEYMLSKFGKIARNAALETFAMMGVRSGDQILIQEPTTGLSGIYFVRASKTIISNGQSYMALDISFEHIAPQEIRQVAEDDMNAIYEAAGQPSTSLNFTGYEPSEVAPVESEEAEE